MILLSPAAPTPRHPHIIMQWHVSDTGLIRALYSTLGKGSSQAQIFIRLSIFMICVIIPYWKISVDIFTQQTSSLPASVSLWLTLGACKTKCIYVFNPLHFSLKKKTLRRHIKTRERCEAVGRQEMQRTSLKTRLNESAGRECFSGPELLPVEL